MAGPTCRYRTLGLNKTPCRKRWSGRRLRSKAVILLHHEESENAFPLGRHPGPDCRFDQRSRAGGADLQLRSRPVQCRPASRPQSGRSGYCTERNLAAMSECEQGAAQVPNAVTDADFAELKKHYTDAQIVDIVAVISLFGFLNRFNDTIATELEASPIEAGKRFLAKKSWSVGKHAA